jgi:hypothetical protein
MRGRTLQAPIFCGRVEYIDKQADGDQGNQGSCLCVRVLCLRLYALAQLVGNSF